MKLRTWQTECLLLAYEHYTSGRKSFLCVATPGAGKTVMAAQVALRLLEKDMIDFVLCIAPSVSVKNGVTKTMISVLKKPFDGKFGSIGECVTYQSLLTASSSLFNRLRHYRVLVVADEIHHCGGIQQLQANGWAQPLLNFISQSKPYVFSMSGTPWRTDRLPVTTILYNDSAEANVDYCYGLNEALRDKVCRVPLIHIIDNSQWKVTTDNAEPRCHNDLKSLLKIESINYQRVLCDERFLQHILILANEQLSLNRQDNWDAAGLIVASSIQHAVKIQQLLLQITSGGCVLVTSDNKDSQKKIEEFKISKCRWLVSVGMVTEGTDIPRLQVCCHLSQIRTELHFRQVLGRILRSRKDEVKKSADLFIPAQPDLLIYANRLLNELPNHPDILKLITSPARTNLSVDEIDSNTKTNNHDDNLEFKTDLSTKNHLVDHISIDMETTSGIDDNEITQSIKFSAYGRYVKEVLSYYN